MIPKEKLEDLTVNEIENTITLLFKEFNMVCKYMNITKEISVI